MESLAALAAALSVLAAQGAIWYKLGRVEGKLDLHLQKDRRPESEGTPV